MSKNWFLSYPRTGSNWVAYCIETLTPAIVPGSYFDNLREIDLKP